MENKQLQSNLRKFKNLNQSRLHFLYLDKLIREEGHESVNIDPNDRLTDWNGVKQSFLTNSMKTVNDLGETIFIANPEFIDHVSNSQISKNILDNLYQDILNEAYSYFEENIKEKPLKEIPIIEFFENLSNIHHEYNDQKLINTYLKILTLIKDESELSYLKNELSDNKIVFSKDILSNKKVMLEEFLMKDEYYKNLNQEIKNILIDSFYNDIKDIEKVSMLSTFPTKNPSDEMTLFRDIYKDRRFKNINVSGNPSFVNYQGVFKRAIKKIHEGARYDDVIFQFKALVETNTIKNIIQHTAMKKALNSSEDYIKYLFKDDQSLNLNIFSHKIDHVLSENRLDDKIKDEPEKKPRFRFGY